VDKIIENLPVVQPTYMAAVPRIFEKVYNGVAAKARAGGGAKYKIFQWAAEVAREYAKVAQDNFRRTGTASVPFGLGAKHKVADALVYAKIREAFGGNLRACVSGSAALAPEIGYFFSGAGIHILEGYGLTETSALVSTNPPGAVRPGSVGKPVEDVELRIVGENDEELPPGEVGEICCRTSFAMLGYWRDPTQTSEVMRGGWLHTADMGYVDEDGYLFVVDRKKDLIIRGGFNVFPRDVEDALLEHPAVAAAGVVGRPDEERGEEVVAFVALRDGEELTDEELVGYAKERIGGYKYPREVRIVPSVPLTPVGKVDRKALRALV
jgi:long-chain acyl-CoA synthetase